MMLSLISVFKGPTIWDRLLSLNVLSSKLVLAIVMYASINYSRMFIDVAIVYTLLSFIGIVFISDFMKKGFKKGSGSKDD